MRMSDHDYQKYTEFVQARRQYSSTQTPEEKEKFYNQVKHRVVDYLEAIEKHELRNMLANLFWNNGDPYNEEIAMQQAHEIGWGHGGKENPYTWYLLLKPHARKMAKKAKQFTQHFEK